MSKLILVLAMMAVVMQPAVAMADDGPHKPMREAFRFIPNRQVELDDNLVQTVEFTGPRCNADLRNRSGGSVEVDISFLVFNRDGVLLWGDEEHWVIERIAAGRRYIASLPFKPEMPVELRWSRHAVGFDDTPYWVAVHRQGKYLEAKLAATAPSNRAVVFAVSAGASIRNDWELVADEISRRIESLPRGQKFNVVVAEGEVIKTFAGDDGFRQTANSTAENVNRWLKDEIEPALRADIPSAMEAATPRGVGRVVLVVDEPISDRLSDRRIFADSISEPLRGGFYLDVVNVIRHAPVLKTIDTPMQDLAKKHGGRFEFLSREQLRLAPETP